MYQVAYYEDGSMEWMDKTSFRIASERAREQSLEEGVSEALVYDENGTLIEAWVDGEEVDIAKYLEQDFSDEWVDDYDYPFDEVGYDPYTGGYDADL